MVPRGEVRTPSLRDRLGQARLSIASPSGAIELEADGGGSLAVAVSPSVLRGWSESALEREIVATIEAALRAARRVYVQARRAAPDGSSGDQPARTVDAPGSDPADGGAGDQTGATAHQRQSHDPIDAFRNRLDRLAVNGMSQLGYITVVRDRDHQFQVRIGRGMLGRLTQPEVEEEIRSALVDALASYEGQYVEAYRSAFGMDPGTGAGVGHA